MDRYVIRINGKEYEVEVEKKEDGITVVPIKKTTSDVAINREDSSKIGENPVADFKEKTISPAGKNAADMAGKSDMAGEKVTAGTAGKVWKITAGEGESVKRGDSIIVLEAMKMEIPVVAPCDGTVGKIFVNEGDSVDMGQAIAIVA